LDIGITFLPESEKKFLLRDLSSVEALGGRNGSKPPFCSDAQVKERVIEAEIKYWHLNKLAQMGHE